MNLTTPPESSSAIIELTPELQIRILALPSPQSARRQLDVRLYRRQAAADGDVFLPTVAGFRLEASRAAEFAGKLLAVAKGSSS